MSNSLQHLVSPASILGSRRVAVVTVTAGLVLAGVGSAYAVDQRDAARDGQVNACISVQTKALRLETPQEPCVTSGPPVAARAGDQLEP